RGPARPRAHPSGRRSAPTLDPDMSFWSAGAHCPIERCHFAYGRESHDEAELDIIGAIVMEAHSQRSHDGAPVTVGSYKIAPKMQAIDEDESEAGERPRLINQRRREWHADA